MVDKVDADLGLQRVGLRCLDCLCVVLRFSRCLAFQFVPWVMA